MPRKRPNSSAVVSIDSQRPAASAPDQPLQPPPHAGNPPNKYTRSSFLRMFLLGNGIWRIARHHRYRPSLVEAELREQLVQHGALRTAWNGAAADLANAAPAPSSRKAA
jgi:hypothetical protein